MMKNRFAGQVAIITGASRGIGRATTEALLAEGAATVMVAAHKDRLERAANELAARHPANNILAVATDVRDPRQIGHAVFETIKTLKRIDILVNNAGVAVYKPVEKMTESEWDLTLDTNLKGIFLFSKAVLPYMRQQNSGRIINISSGLGTSGFPGLAAYSASKFAVLGFTESLAYELEDTGIKVHAVLPGGVDTDMYHSIFPGTDPRTLLRPEQIAAAILKFADPASQYRTGARQEVYRHSRL